MGVVEIARLITFWDALSMIPLYLSFLPFIMFHLLARDAALYLSVFWFIAMMAINIQVADQKINNHVLGASATFLGECLASGV